MGPRQETELDRLAIRVSEFINSNTKPVSPSQVNLSHIAEMCWALGIKPDLVFKPNTCEPPLPRKK